MPFTSPYGPAPKIRYRALKRMICRRWQHIPEYPNAMSSWCVRCGERVMGSAPPVGDMTSAHIRENLEYLRGMQ